MLGKVDLGDAERRQELLQQDFAGMAGDAVGGNHGAPSGRAYPNDPFTSRKPYEMQC